MNRIKYIIFFSLTVFAVIAVFSFSKDTVTVTVTEIKSERADRTMTCSGKIESKNVTPVELDFPVVFSRVNFKTGDCVEKGDVLAVIDKAATIDFLSELIDSYSGVLSVSALNSLPLEKISAMIPENVVAPVSGILSGSEVDGKKYTNIQSPVFSISDTSDLTVRLAVGESKIASVKEGQYAIISGQGFSGKYYGKVTEISSAARDNFSLSGSNTVVDVYVSVPNDSKTLRPGLTASTTILTSVNKDAVIIPFDSILQDSDNNEYVYVVDGDTAHKRIIKTGVEHEKGTEVLSGLADGDLLITNPSKVKDGMNVKIS